MFNSNLLSMFPKYQNSNITFYYIEKIAMTMSNDTAKNGRHLLPAPLVESHSFGIDAQFYTQEMGIERVQ